MYTFISAMSTVKITINVVLRDKGGWWMIFFVNVGQLTALQYLQMLLIWGNYNHEKYTI